ncbi:MAG: pentapeptide repeat-containing protein [Gemmatimonadetes bacterium]|nr:pentapeptide repeat-containing protein [Gemmatimonadota bacterium]
MSNPRPITVLHVSDPQFGKNHRFGRLAPDMTPDESFDTLLSRLKSDLDLLREERHGLRPDLFIITGDLAEWGLKSEFEQALPFLVEITDHLELSRERVAIIPGNHDINRRACESYFNDCEANEEEPRTPYWPKWRHYHWFFSQFFRDVPGFDFTEDEPWTIFEVPDLKVVIAGLNSTMRESHRDEDHYGWVGEAQLRWFAERLKRYREEGWFRIGAVHHNVRRGEVADDENLRDADDLNQFVGPYLNCLLHGHTHHAKWDRLREGVPILSTGSAALEKDVRPEDVPNQYQVIQFWPDRLKRWARQYEASRKGWIGDTRASETGDDWREEHKVAFRDVTAAFPPANPGTDVGTGESVDGSEKARREAHGREHALSRDDFLSRVEEVTRLKSPDARLDRIRAADPPIEYLRVTKREEGFARTYPLAAVAGGVDGERLEQFLIVHRRYRATDTGVTSVLVYGGERAAAELEERAARERVQLVSFTEYQGLIDFRHFVEQQTARLQSDQAYPPSLYVPQRMRYRVGEEDRSSDDALGTIESWLVQSGRFVLVLGDFGTGKTFLMRELARRLGATDSPLVPIRIELRKLEKAQGLNELVAQHFANAGMERIDLPAFRYMLEQGLLALLFDGFDELALRVTYERAADHLDTLLQAARGDARVVVASRTQHFVSDRQVLTALGEKLDAVVGRRIVRLAAFDRGQIRQFFINLLGSAQQADDRMSLLDDIKDLAGLSANPRMLAFISTLEPEDLQKARDAEGEITAARLYELILTKWLKYEFERQSPPGAVPVLSEDDRWAAVTQIALHLWERTEAGVAVGDLTQAAAFAAERLADLKLDVDVATHQVGSGTLLVRDENGNFSFLHQSILEWLVARKSADQLLAGGSATALRARSISTLMADFLRDLAGHAVTSNWARQVLAGEASDVEKRNALLVLERLEEEIHEPVDLADKTLAGADLSKQDLSGARLTGADLTNALLVDTILNHADLSDAVLRDADLTRAKLHKASLRRADLAGARLLGADLTGVTLESANLRRAKLIGAVVDREELYSADTYGAALPDHAAVLPWLDSALGPLASVAWSPSKGKLDGQLLASGGDDNTVRLWEVESGRELRRLEGHSGSVQSVAFSPDGQRLASGGHDDTVRLWEVESGRELRRLEGHSSWVLSVAFSPDGQRLASGGRDNTVRLWEWQSGEMLIALGHVADGWVAFTASGRYRFGGEVSGQFWHSIALCRFELGELDPYLPLRMAEDEVIIRRGS